MERVSTNGKSQNRQLRLGQLETGTGQVQTMVVLEFPGAIADTALPTWSNSAADDDQLPYPPAIKRASKSASPARAPAKTTPNSDATGGRPAVSGMEHFVFHERLLKKYFPGLFQQSRPTPARAGSGNFMPDLRAIRPWMAPEAPFSAAT